MRLLTTLIGVFHMTVVIRSQTVQGELNNGDGYILSWMGDFGSDSVTFTIQGPGDGSYVVGFSVTKDYHDADIIVAYDRNAADQSAAGYRVYDYYTNSESDTLLEDPGSKSFQTSSRTYDATNMVTTTTFTRRITAEDPTSSEDVSLDQCVYVIWGYSPNKVEPGGTSLGGATYTATGIFEEQLCSLQVAGGVECPVRNSAACTDRIEELACCALRLDNSGGSIPLPCATVEC